MFTQIVFIEQFRLHIRQLRGQLAREQPHIGTLLKHHGVVDGIGGIFTLGKRAVRMNQYRRDLRRIQTALFKGFNNHLAGLILVLSVNLLNGHQSGTGDRAIEIVGVGGAPGGQIEPGLRPDCRMAGMGMHDLCG